VRISFGIDFDTAYGDAASTSSEIRLPMLLKLATPAVADFGDETAATCSANGTTTVSNYDATKTYTFSPASGITY
jgi:hypothetical protein